MGRNQKDVGDDAHIVPLLEEKMFMDIQVGDILTMKKPHPCGDKRWLVLRTGADFRLRCIGCGHEVMTPRFKAEKNIRAVQKSAT